jgi:hypothetical protein
MSSSTVLLRTVLLRLDSLSSYINNNIIQALGNFVFEYGKKMVEYNGYALGTGPDLLYTVNGEACDWMYGVHGIYAYTPEIGTGQDGFWPQTSRIVPLAEENLYSNQFLALVAGSKYTVDVSIGEGPFNADNIYPLNISIFNQGLGNSNGEVTVDISLNSKITLSELEISTVTSPFELPKP